jgi:hypothetical protein
MEECPRILYHLEERFGRRHIGPPSRVRGVERDDAGSGHGYSLAEAPPITLHGKSPRSHDVYASQVRGVKLAPAREFQHIDGERDLKVQLKGRFTVEQKYRGKQIWIAFRSGETWYLYDHDAVFDHVRDRIETSGSWQNGGYSWPRVPEWASAVLETYRLA